VDVAKTYFEYMKKLKLVPASVPIATAADGSARNEEERYTSNANAK